ncbi:MAG: mandelate racemase/muconate lactonizing enzyme family protein [Candidatus Abyssobacteria bacterium SURF_5]|uniref:Mandelate racemase/muconate lactonizing enzyme family protein n=1 Tax=Abyssobacteria bacterium (strain SURF_5) TaxID=2093360 RepID=A0A3A4P0J5_ABYX5|nr:MAG: mandelate racemase/muconate lactonizing enzyme family protein [Candidatus Abyssubacteria bacterium SURF_5]
MRIIDVKATPLRTHSVFVQVLTDEGVTGIGECSPMNPLVLSHFVETALKPIILNEDPLETERLWNNMTFRTYKLGVQGVQPEAIAGIDIALWDIKGKVTGLPIHTLLGGCCRKKVLMYASIGGGAHMAVSDMAAYVQQFLEKGFKAFKIRMDYVGSTAGAQDVDLKKDYEMFKAIRELIGDDIPLSFDANNGYSVSAAIAQGRRFEELGIYHYEEPVAQFDYRGIAQVANALDVPVSAGEHEYNRWQFRDLIEQAQVDIIQPDVVKCGGISEMQKIAVLGSVYNKHFVPHQTQPTIGTAANLHVVAAHAGATRPQEYSGQNLYLDDLFEEPLVLEDGYLYVPQKPGLGLELNAKKMMACAL